MNLDTKPTSVANDILGGIGFLIFIALMLGLLSCPIWLPSIIEKLLIR